MDIRTVYFKVLQLHSEIEKALLEYMKDKEITPKNYQEKLADTINKPATDLGIYISDNSEMLREILDEIHPASDRELELISCFVKGIITNKIAEKMVNFEIMKDPL